MSQDKQSSRPLQNETRRREKGVLSLCTIPYRFSNFDSKDNATFIEHQSYNNHVSHHKMRISTAGNNAHAPPLGVFISIMALNLCYTAAAFHARIPQRPSSLGWLLPQHGDNNNDFFRSYSSSKNNDFGDNDNHDGFVGGNDDGLDETGQALAKEFTRELKLREEKQQQEEQQQKATETNNTVKPNQEEQQQPPPPPFPRSSSQKPKFKKFTGASSNTSAGLFSGSGDRVYSIPNQTTPQGGGRNTISSSSSSQQQPMATGRDRIIEQEFRLLGRPEQTIAVQALFAVAVLSFYVYVGLTGGITDRIEPDTPFDWDSLSDNIAAVEELSTRSTTDDADTMVSPMPSSPPATNGDIWL